MVSIDQQVVTYRVEGEASPVEWRLASGSPSFCRPLLGRAHRRREVLGKSVNWARVLFVAVNGEVAGYLQFYLHGEGPHRLRFHHMREAFGGKAAWRYPLYRALHRRFERCEAYLYRVVIAEPFRGQGLGQRLLQDWLALLSDEEVTRVDLDVWGNNLRAIAFYANLGFSERRRLSLPLRASWLRDRQLIQMHREC